MERIVDPLSGKIENIFSQRGREILKLYIVNYSIGGSCESSEPLYKKIKQLKDNINNTFSAKTYKKYLECFLNLNKELLEDNATKK